MNAAWWGDATGLLAAFLLLTWLIAWPLGRALAALGEGRLGMLARADAAVLRAAGVDPAVEQDARRYALSLLMFNALGVAAVFALQMLQGVLPLNPQGFGAPSWHSALNTAVSFVTNTNWQGYAGEQTMSALTQMFALAVQNFLSAATGIAVALALVRGFARSGAKSVGNFWADLTRITLWLLLPLSVLLALVFAWQGVPQTFGAFVHAGDQVLPVGPIASQEAIKMIGTNGGGILNANSAHPFENPNALTNALADARPSSRSRPALCMGIRQNGR